MKTTETTPPLVSVCMTTYNHEAYLAQAIEGVLAQQTPFEVELVIGEDCSTDNTRALCESYAARYPERIRLIVSERNVGMRANYRRVVEACRGTYIAMCDGDDWWCDPQKLARQVELLEADPTCGVCYTRAQYWSESERRIVEIFPGKEVNCTFEELLLNSSIPNCTAVVRADLARSYYTEVRPLAQPWPLDDYGMWLWCATRSRIRFLDRITACYRVIADSGSHFSDPRKRFRYEEGILQIQLWFDRHFGNGSRRKELLTRRLLQELFLLRPRGFRAMLHGWLRCVVRHPNLLLLGRGYHRLKEGLRSPVKKTDKA